MAVACYLIVHPKGTLIWDTGAVPDDAWHPTGDTATQRLVLPNGQERFVVMRRPLRAQLEAIGVPPERVTYLALSHDHYDHTANVAEFTGATWLARERERDAMFAPAPPPFSQPATYATLRAARTIVIHGDDSHDVFGDGSVVIRSAPGHTPGHQVLFLRLAETGPVILAGDLWHFPQQRALDRVSTVDADTLQSRASRAAIEAFATRTGARIWIQHDLAANAALRKAPGFYQ
jgi:glyoxylase-like metal-dependent hydrolase (beta-lactamase superfamily II)